MRAIYLDWYPPLSPARQRVWRILMLLMMPLVVIFGIWWAGVFRDALTAPRQDLGAGRYIDPWKLNEEVVRSSYRFTHEEYVEWLENQRHQR